MTRKIFFFILSVLFVSCSVSSFAYTVFQDDFSDPVYTANNWDNAHGSWEINADGRYEATQPNAGEWSRSFLTNIPQLTEYTVEFDYHVYDADGGGVGSGVLFHDSYPTPINLHAASLIIRDEADTTYWHLAAPSGVNHAAYTFFDGQDLHFRIEVENGSYEVYINDSLHTSVTAAVDSSYYFGFYDCDAGIAFDNVILYVGAPDSDGSATVPEPATLLLLIGSLTSLVRRYIS